MRKRALGALGLDHLTLEMPENKELTSTPGSYQFRATHEARPKAGPQEPCVIAKPSRALYISGCTCGNGFVNGVLLHL